MVDEENIKKYIEYLNNCPKLTEEEMKVYKKKYFKEYYEKNTEKIKEKARLNYQLNREKKLQQSRERYHRLKEQNKN